MEDLDTVMQVRNQLEYSGNYSMISGSLRNYYRDEVNYDINERNAAVYYRINNKKTTKSKFFEYKKKISGSMAVGNSRLDAAAVVPLKHVNFLRSLDLPLINY